MQEEIGNTNESTSIFESKFDSTESKCSQEQVNIQANIEPDDKDDIVQGEPLPSDAPKNWTGASAVIILVLGSIAGFLIPVIGFMFYIIFGTIALILSLASFVMFRKYKTPTITIGALICSIFLLGLGLFHFFTILSTIETAIIVIQENQETASNILNMFGGR